MPSHTETRIVPYTAQQMFDLVADVERYPDFLPWCLATQVYSRSPSLLLVELTVGSGFLKNSFTSQVSLTSPEHIEVTYKNGPFRYLDNHWAFKNLPEKGCEVCFHIDFAFKSGLFNQAIAPFFSEAVNIMVQAFEKRAQHLYGKMPSPVFTDSKVAGKR